MHRFIQKCTLLLVSICGLIISVTTLAAEQSGHPILNPFPGTRVANHKYFEYEELNLILSKPYYDKKDWVADKLQLVGGKVTYTEYQKPEKNSALQVFRNYQKAIKKQNMEILFNCERPCSDVSFSAIPRLLNASTNAFTNLSSMTYYIAAKKGNTYLMLWLDNQNIEQFVIEEEALDDNLISPIALALSENGKIDLYGFHFDSGKSELKQGSEDELMDLADVLGQYPELNIHIIGHTDSIGDKNKNQKLSAARAKSVSKALQRDYAVNSTRINTSGKGESQPIADNSTQEGKAQNRRVEIIALNPGVIVTDTGNESTKVANQTSEKKQKKEKQQQKNAFEHAKEKVKTAEEVKDLTKRFKGLF